MGRRSSSRQRRSSDALLWLYIYSGLERAGVLHLHGEIKYIVSIPHSVYECIIQVYVLKLPSNQSRESHASRTSNTFAQTPLNADSPSITLIGPDDSDQLPQTASSVSDELVLMVLPIVLKSESSNPAYRTEQCESCNSHRVTQLNPHPSTLSCYRKSKPIHLSFTSLLSANN